MINRKFKKKLIMPLKSPVLLSAITNLSDARFAAGMGVEYLSFNMNQSHKDFIGLNDFTAITAWLHGPKFVGEFEKGTGIEEILERVKEFELENVLVHDAKLILALKAQGLFVIQYESEITESPEKVGDILVVELSEGVDALVLEVPENTFLGTGIDHSNVNEILDDSAFTGIALKGSEEIRTGYVDLDEMAEILEAIEVDN